MTVPGLKIVRYSPLEDFHSISFARRFVKDEQTGYIYAYGSKLSFIAGELYVARIPIQPPGAPRQFWDGRAWNHEAGKAVIVLLAH